MVYKSGKLRNLKITTLLQKFYGKGEYKLWMGICNNVNLINLLQPNRICTSIWINNIQYNLNMQYYVYARKKRNLLCFSYAKEFWPNPKSIKKDIISWEKWLTLISNLKENKVP